MKNEGHIESKVNVLQQQVSFIGPQVIQKIQTSGIQLLTSTVLKMNEAKPDTSDRDNNNVKTVLDAKKIN